MPQFRGFPQEGLTFFRQLKKNNNRDWFTPRKDVFEEKLKAPMADLVDAINSELVKFAPQFITDPKKAIYRIYRDTRFSTDKTPYKTQIAASFSHSAMEKHASAGYYMAVSDAGVDVAGGIYMPGPEELLIVRTLISENYGEFHKLTSGKKLQSLVGELHGEELTRVPKGFAAGDPAAAMLRRKQWYFYLTLDASLATGSRLLPEITKRFRAVQPFVDFLNAPLLARKKKASRSMLA